MRILHVIDQIGQEHGGSAEAARQITAALEKRGHDISVYSTATGTVNGEYRLFKPFFSYAGSIHITPAMLFTNYNYDVIHLHNYYTFQNLVARLRAARTPIVHQPHGTFVMYNRALYKSRPTQQLTDRPWRSWFLGRMNRTICVSDIELRQARELGLTNTIKIPNGINMEDFKDVPKRGAFREKLSISQSDKLVLYLGRDHPLKGTDSLRQAWEHVTTPGARLIMVGVNHPPLYGREKLEAYVDADLYVLPSLYDIFGITALEAMACGTRAIVSPNCGIGEYLDIQYEEDKLSETIDEILHLPDTPEERATRIAAAGTFDWNVIVEKMENVYRELVG